MAKPITIRRSLILSFAAVIMLLTMLLVGLTFVGAAKRAEEQSHRLLRRATAEINARLATFFQTPRRLLDVGRAWGHRAVDDGGKAFLASAGPAIDQIAQIADLRLDPVGRWTPRDFQDRPVRWGRPRRLPSSGLLGMTAVTPVTGSDGTRKLIAVDMLLDEISAFTRSLDVTENARVLAMVPHVPPSQQAPDEFPEGLVIGLPNDARFADPKAREGAYLTPARALGLSVFADGIGPFLARGPAQREKPLRFDSGGQPWWGAVAVYPLDPDLPVMTAVVIPERDLLGDHRLMRLFLVLGAGLAFGLALGIATMLSSRAGKPIQALVVQTDRIRKGDFSPGDPIPTRIVEVKRLTEAHEEMREGLENLTRLEHELKVARQIQQGTFPSEMPVVPGYDLYGRSVPAEDTGGDTVDLMSADDGAVLMLADATGHGIGPALSVAHLHAMLRMAVRSGTSLDETVRHANAQLRENLTGGRFITAWFGILDPQAHELQCYSCGQGPVFHYHAASEEFEPIGCQSPPMGIFDIAVTLPPPTTLEIGDMYVVLSDGFHEASNADETLFAEKRVRDVLRQHAARPASEIVDALHAAVEAFTNNAPADDDRTCIIVKRLG